MQMQTKTDETPMDETPGPTGRIAPRLVARVTRLVPGETELRFAPIDRLPLDTWFELAIAELDSGHAVAIFNPDMGRESIGRRYAFELSAFLPNFSVLTSECYAIVGWDDTLVTLRALVKPKWLEWLMPWRWHLLRVVTVELHNRSFSGRVMSYTANGFVMDVGQGTIRVYYDMKPRPPVGTFIRLENFRLDYVASTFLEDETSSTGAARLDS
jgi:hypothetical protein